MYILCFVNTVGLVRVSDVSKAKLYEENLKLGAVYDAVNYVSSIPWTINTKVPHYILMHFVLCVLVIRVVF